MKKLSLAFIAILLSACAVATPIPLATPKAIDSSTLENTSTPLSIVAVPTVTEEPSAIPLPTETIEPASAEQAENAKSTKIAEFSVTCLENYGSVLSPNEIWLAIFCLGNGKTINLEILNKEGKGWLLKFTDYFEETVSGELRAQHWSNDGEYLYFSPALGLSGGGSPCLISFGLQGLYRIKLNDGNVATVLPPYQGYFFAFSPTDRRLAYQGNGNLMIRDLQTGDETNTGESGLTDHPVWSEDGKELFYPTCKENWDTIPAEIQKSAIKMFSVVSNTSKIIIEREKTFLSIINVDTNGIITIGSNDESYRYTEIYFDLNANLWVTPIPTP